MANVVHNDGETIIDVREDLRAGREPFPQIMQALEEKPRENDLVLFATFKPEPLIAVMASRGYKSEASELPDGEWKVRFSPAND